MKLNGFFCKKLVDFKLFRALIILILLVLSSCVSKSERANNNFLQSYGEEVDRINKNREIIANGNQINYDDSQNNKKISFWDDLASVFGVSGTNQFKSAKVDTSGLKFFVPNREEFTPDLQTLLEGRKKSLPAYIFDINYSLVNYPSSYGKPGISFDDIIIPGRDAFGIASKLGDKDYNLVGKDNLQRNVDYINSNIDNQDKILSMMIIKEQKELKSRGRIGIPSGGSSE